MLTENYVTDIPDKQCFVSGADICARSTSDIATGPILMENLIITNMPFSMSIKDESITDILLCLLKGEIR